MTHFQSHLPTLPTHIDHSGQPHPPLSLIGVQRAVDLVQLSLQGLDLGLGKVLLKRGLVLGLGVLTDAGKSLGALEEEVLLLYGLTESDPACLQLGAQSLGVANGALQDRTDTESVLNKSLS